MLLLIYSSIEAHSIYHQTHGWKPSRITGIKIAIQRDKNK